MRNTHNYFGLREARLIHRGGPNMPSNSVPEKSKQEETPSLKNSKDVVTAGKTRASAAGKEVTTVKKQVEGDQDLSARIMKKMNGITVLRHATIEKVQHGGRTNEYKIYVHSDKAAEAKIMLFARAHGLNPILVRPADGKAPYVTVQIEGYKKGQGAYGPTSEGKKSTLPWIINRTKPETRNVYYTKPLKTKVEGEASAKAGVNTVKAKPKAPAKKPAVKPKTSGEKKEITPEQANAKKITQVQKTISTLEQRNKNLRDQLKSSMDALQWLQDKDKTDATAQQTNGHMKMLVQLSKEIKKNEDEQAKAQADLSTLRQEDGRMAWEKKEPIVDTNNQKNIRETVVRSLNRVKPALNERLKKLITNSIFVEVEQGLQPIAVNLAKTSFDQFTKEAYKNTSGPNFLKKFDQNGLTLKNANNGVWTRRFNQAEFNTFLNEIGKDS